MGCDSERKRDGKRRMRGETVAAVAMATAMAAMKGGSKGFELREKIKVRVLVEKERGILVIFFQHKNVIKNIIKCVE